MLDKHTPGPWEAHSSIYNHMIAEVRSVAPGEERGIAQIWAHKNGYADARLMAAAPELLDALRECLQEHGGFAIKGECERRARDVIARATGWI